MKYRVESFWTMAGVQFIEADSEYEAEQSARNGPLPLPEESEYLSDSYEIGDIEAAKNDV